MEKNPEFDDIRPFYDDEVAPVIDRLLNNSQFLKILDYLFQGERREQVERLLRTFTNKRDFQHLLIKNVVFEILNRTGSTATFDGLENISKQSACTYISNHRDIVLDVAILSSLLAENGYDTVEIAIGDNLLLADWIIDLVRLNKSFMVKRSESGRQMLEFSKHLSKYIHYTIREKNQSIWIAQREGRAKDSNDRTQEALLKMLAMGTESGFLKNLTALNLTPLTFSYEYDPCDYLKAKEFQQKRDNPDYKKTRQDDWLWGNNYFQDKYTTDDIENFEKYFQQQLNKIDLPDKDIVYLTERMEEMYAYPVKNHLSIINYELSTIIAS
jgi:hypothetical protein